MTSLLHIFGDTFPAFGGSLLLGAMVVASYTFAVALAAGANGRPRTLQAARFGAYGTVAMIGTAVVCLAYAFVTHDFRIRYVSHYSDRSMPLHYLFTALWGGQDGSLLWWLFLLSAYIGVCVRWLGKRYLELQPYVIATLMAIVLFFCILMAFAANPFATNLAGARADGDGLNPALQNYWMVIHPPCLYTGFVGCSVPFAFGVAALVTGRLDHEWIVASRKWTLFAWMFLGIGNTLGMLWAYESLGWGGYWGWDPVENAACMPFLVASAYVHSVMIQERRGLLKVWNVFLVGLMFFLTIFGTFLTRSGMIASVHAFAQSSIGNYFAVFLCVIVTFLATLVLWRWPELRDLPPSARLRWAAVTSGWLVILVCGPGLVSLWHLSLPMTLRVTLIAAVAGAGVFVALEVVFRRMTAGLDLTVRRPRIESIVSREFTFLLNNWALCSLLFFILVATTFPLISEAITGEKVTVGPACCSSCSWASARTSAGRRRARTAFARPSARRWQPWASPPRCTSRSGEPWGSPPSCGAIRSTPARSAPCSASSTRSAPSSESRCACSTPPSSCRSSVSCSGPARGPARARRPRPSSGGSAACRGSSTRWPRWRPRRAAGTAGTSATSASC